MEVEAVCPTFIRGLLVGLRWYMVVYGGIWWYMVVVCCWCCLFRCDVVRLGSCARVGFVLGPPGCEILEI